MTLAPVVTRIRALPAKDGGRTLIAVAGPPGSGKSTLAEALVQALGPDTALLPMDGFHLDNRLLEPKGLLSRKGAPETFDVAGFATCLERVASGAPIFVPLFDRDREIAVAAAAEIPATCKTIIIEGNYLLFQQPPWSGLAALWDLTIWLDIPDNVLKQRLTARWLSYGFAPAAAAAKVQNNDLPNAVAIKSQSAPADIILGADWASAAIKSK
ncbi:nucleoside/nucleotide kinase family protein [Actibacterium sp. 188UL27-1]|uniref:nucleoside/nucleotide kinase family protein n=1 Tax=Actibacterium sp. 188UL27-1 TaxID=2786961 RepID=UPI00195C9B6B|nr:nucleoside/nucleotide kinase family protein [Actibacterium sp. 188UL27-1]MBM7067033.1 nucleoside/nucleotide kinase family protein [Actibacterium sp. 188UL27-1]